MFRTVHSMNLYTAETTVPLRISFKLIYYNAQNKNTNKKTVNKNIFKLNLTSETSIICRNDLLNQLMFVIYKIHSIEYTYVCHL